MQTMKEKGHLKMDCQELVGEPPNKRCNGQDELSTSCKHQKTKQTNTAEEELITFAIEEVVANVNESRVNNKCFILYDWLADSVTMTHMTNQWDTFITYFPATGNHSCRSRKYSNSD